MASPQTAVSPVKYIPLSQFEIDLVTGFKASKWNGPGLPRPDGKEGLDEILATLGNLLTRAQNLIQAKNGLSIPYTLQGITAPGKRFMLGTDDQIQSAADIKSLVTFVQSFASAVFTEEASQKNIASHVSLFEAALKSPLEILKSDLTDVAGAAGAGVDIAVGAEHKAADYSAFSLESPEQFAMAWTTFGDMYRSGYPHLAEYTRLMTDADAATKQFWPMLRSTALPYNLFILMRLTDATAAYYKTRFGAAWKPEYDALLAAKKLYGIDLTVFEGLDPDTDANGTLRFTPSTMALLSMDDAKNLTPIAVYVTDPKNKAAAQVFTKESGAWIYALMAVKTSLTVYGIWLGHVYTLHIVTAAMQMVTLNTLPASNAIWQLLAPQSNYTIAFDLLLMLGWSNLSPPTSISSTAKFLQLCNNFLVNHSFFATDPSSIISRMNLDVNDFTDPAQPGGEWNLYPNFQIVRRIEAFTWNYVSTVIDAAYADDAAVSNDADIQAWIAAAGAPTAGNIQGLPAMDSKANLKSVLSSVLYRITFHGMGRLRNVGSPEPPFAPNYPPCLQSTAIPSSASSVNTAALLRYLPNTGTLGKLVSFYYIFAYNEPYVPVVPYQGPDAELFFDDARYPGANAALVQFRREIESLVREYQPQWVQIGQWPRNIEL